MKKIIIILIIFVNFLFIFLIYNCFNSYIKNKTIKLSNDNEIEVENIENTEEPQEESKEWQYIFCGEDRSEFIPKQYSNNKPVIMFGCSYAYGHGLKREESFPYLISDITKRPVINFAVCGSHILSNLISMEEYINKSKKNKKTLQNAEYAIYVYMHDHIKRFLIGNTVAVHYEKLFKPSNIEQKLINIYSIKYLLTSLRMKEFENKIEDFLLLVLMSMHENIKKVAPNAKIIIVIYDEKVEEEFVPFMKLQYNSVWNRYEALTGDTVIHTKDITGFLFDKNYKLKADIAGWHPNAKVWKVFTPKFVKKYIK